MITLGAVTLPADLAWPDRIWSPVVVTTDTGLTGAPILQLSPARTVGRPITLQGSTSEGRALVDRATVDALVTLQASGDPVALSVRGESFTVIILSVDATPVWDYADDSDPLALTIKMVTV